VADELGEFVHGRPREIWQLIESAHLETHEVGGSQVIARVFSMVPELRRRVERLLERMSTTRGDLSFRSSSRPPRGSSDSNRERPPSSDSTPRTPTASAFNGSSIPRSGQSIAADHSYRLVDGYGELVAQLVKRVEDGACDLRLNTPVRAMRWRQGAVTIVTGKGETLKARRAVVSLPLGVLRVPVSAGGIAFDPDLGAKRDAFAKIAVGDVARVVLVFRARFWEHLERSGRSLERLSFLFSSDPWFPTWWTTMPANSPILTGWSAAGRAERLCGRDADWIVERAISSLSDILAVERSVLHSTLQQSYSLTGTPIRFLRRLQLRPRGGAHFGRAGRPARRNVVLRGE
jgi:hypothetical protein